MRCGCAKWIDANIRRVSDENKIGVKRWRKKSVEGEVK